MSKIVLITGSSTGLGAETARFLAFQNEIIVHYEAFLSVYSLVRKRK